jgi:hypothetical protein
MHSAIKDDKIPSLAVSCAKDIDWHHTRIQQNEEIADYG